MAATRRAAQGAPIDAAAFRGAMARLGAAVSIVTTAGPAGRAGLTATAVCSVTDAPPTLLVCINRNSRSLEAVKANGAVAVNVLREGHRDLALRFSGAGDTPEVRFATGNWCEGTTGAPLLADALVSFDCRLADAAIVGSHEVLFCTVVAVSAQADRDGLFYFSRDFCRLAATDPAATHAG